MKTTIHFQRATTTITTIPRTLTVRPREEKTNDFLHNIPTTNKTQDHPTALVFIHIQYIYLFTQDQVEKEKDR